MKKTFIASTLALTLGAAGYAVSGHEAHASETTNVDQAHLVDLAHNHPEQLNAKPVQAGAYDIHFVSGGFQYNFTSDGTNFSWNYQEVGSNASTTQASTTSAQSADYTTSYNQEANTQSVSSNQQSSNTNVEAVSAPTTSSNSSSSHNYSTKTTSYSAPSTSSASTGGSTKAQFLANGGTEAAWNAIVMPESGGNPNAVNPAGYRGLGQTMESWGSGSVASQTKGMLNYAKSRYGSLDSAIAFRQSHGWW